MTADNSNHEAPLEPTVMPDDSPGFLLAERAAYHLLNLQAEDVIILDLRRLSDVCDFFVLGTGAADVQVKAMAREVRDGLLEVGVKPAGHEGEDDGRWVLLDYFDVIVHALKAEVREYYQLERLWADATSLTIDQAHLEGAGFRQRHPDLAPAAGAAESDDDR